MAGNTFQLQQEIKKLKMQIASMQPEKAKLGDSLSCSLPRNLPLSDGEKEQITEMERMLSSQMERQEDVETKYASLEQQYKLVKEALAKADNCTQVLKIFIN